MRNRVLNPTFTLSNINAGGAVSAAKGFSAKRCVFMHNTAPHGGAVSTAKGAKIDSSTFEGNRATLGHGGAIFYLYSTSGTGNYSDLKCNVSSFEKNIALLGNGGAVYATNSQSFNNCAFKKDSARRGGAIYSTAGVQLTASRLTENYASGQAGAIYSTNGVYLSGDTLNNNRADTAGGAFISSGSNITASVFQGNTAGQQGGVAVLSGPNASISKSVFSGNTAGQQGGALVLNGGVVIKNTLFSGNAAGQQGGAMALLNSNPTLENVTMAGDSAISGNGLYCTASSPIVKNCILWEGALNTVFTANNSFPNITYSIVAGGFTGAGNVSTNPAFVAPQPASAAPTTAGDYNVTGCNPGINAGQNTGSYAGVVDLAGNPRLAFTVVDMGAYEFQTSAAGTISGGSNVCLGATLQLTPSISGGTWSSLDPTKATVNASGLVSGVMGGTVIIRYTVMVNGCLVYTDASINVNYQPFTGPPSLAVNFPPCAGTMYIINYTQSSHITASSWAVADTTITAFRGATSPFGTFEAKAAGTTTVTFNVTYYNGCTAVSTLPVTVYAIPSSGVTKVGRTLTAVEAGANYEWFQCVGNSPVYMNAYGRSFTPAQDGDYGVYIFYNLNCRVRSACYPVSPVSVAKVATEGWNLYPNPTTGAVTVQTGASIAAKILVKDITGRQILEIKPTATETTLDVSGFAPGLYLVMVADFWGNTTNLRLTVNGK